MKHQLRDVIIFLIHVLCISLLYRLYMKRKGPLVRVLCFHDVSNRKWFERVVAMLQSKYRIITPEQFHSKHFDEDKINILFTFDDGYQSWIDNCLPVLKQYGIKGIFFINSGLLEIAHDTKKVEEYMRQRLLISPKLPLAWAGAKKLLSEGNTMGGHTETHPNLKNIDFVSQKKEIQEDKEKIEEELHIKLFDFAFPFGSTVGSETGYAYNYSTEASFVKNDLYIPRLCVEKEQSLMQIGFWVEGAYDIFRIVKTKYFIWKA